jgi:hypothetical protein
MNLSQLETLKEKLIHAREFSDVVNYFFDHFGEDPAFIALGERAESPFLEAMLETVGQELFGKKVQAGNLLLTRLPEQGFIHGGGTLEGKLANVLYFEDIQMGVLTVVMSMQPNDTKLIRFTGKPMPRNTWKPSEN